MSKTIARSLKDRKTIALNIGKLGSRAIQNAVKKPGKELDFDCQEYIQKYLDTQYELRVLKTKIAQKTANHMVNVPEELPVIEAGKTVPLIQAILIRDDLKAQRGYFEKYVSLPSSEQKYNRETGEYDEIPCERQFNFETMLTKVDKMQDFIDTIDALIQFVDNTEKID